MLTILDVVINIVGEIYMSLFKIGFWLIFHFDNDENIHLSFVIYEERAYGHDSDFLAISHHFVCFVFYKKWEEREMLCSFKARFILH